MKVKVWAPPVEDYRQVWCPRCLGSMLVPSDRHMAVACRPCGMFCVTELFPMLPVDPRGAW